MYKKKQVISQFYNITIEMEPKENYLPHIYAKYGHQVAMFSAESGGLMQGTFPSRERDLVAAWVLLHQQELRKNWEEFLKNNNYDMRPISPLK